MESALNKEKLNKLSITLQNIKPLNNSGELPGGAPAWIYEIDHPYLHGVFTPVAEEMQADSLLVEQGLIPEDLYGMYIVNGPCQRYKPKNKYHYYDGDGMPHAIYLKDGKAHYKSKWVKTQTYNAESELQENKWPGLCGPYDFDLPYGPIKDNSNTDIIFFAGKLLSLWYMAGKPYSIDPLTLDTLGAEDFDGKLTHNLSAHSKVDLRTGELIHFNYQDEAPYMSYGVCNASGELIHDVPIDIPGPRSPHDIGMTSNYSILHDLPYFHDVELLKTKKKRVLHFHDDMPARFGVIPRFGNSSDVHWFEAKPCYILHIVNSWEENNEVIMIGCRQPSPGGRREAIDGPLASQLAERRRVHELHEWRFNLDTGETTERTLDTLNSEFPTINILYRGVKNRFSYHQYLPLPGDLDDPLEGRCQTFNALIKYDLETADYQRYDYGDGVYGSESHFTPKKGADFDSEEDDGYVITYTHDSNDWTSRCLIFDAKDISKGPICTIKMPRRFHMGFHAMWVSGESMGL